MTTVSHPVSLARFTPLHLKRPPETAPLPFQRPYRTRNVTGCCGWKGKSETISLYDQRQYFHRDGAGLAVGSAPLAGVVGRSLRAVPSRWLLMTVPLQPKPRQEFARMKVIAFKHRTEQ